MMRHCDGTDPNLTRRVLTTHFEPATQTRSDVWQGAAAGTDYTIINCACGLSFDDVDHRTTWPHEGF